MSKPLIRTAGPDGVEHATVPGRMYALCGVWATEERLAWPRKVRCSQCVALAEARLHAERDAARVGA